MSTTPLHGAQSTATPEPRRVECAVTIQAPVDVVWRALTDAAELTRWFPLEAQVAPGEGGTIRLRWPGEHDSSARIEVWQPERHLRIVGFPSGDPLPLATDYYLEGQGGATVLRLVSSGFGTGDAWDDLFEGVSEGWAFELFGLQHYLERHRGIGRQVAWARAKYAGDYPQAWARLTGPGGWFGPAGLATPAEGQPFRATTSAGDVLSGVVRLWHPPRQFAATLDGWNDALFRAELWSEASKGGGRALLWLSAYGVPPADLQQLEQKWRTALGRLFGPPR